MIELIQQKIPMPPVVPHQVVQPENPDNIFREVKEGKNVKKIAKELK